MLCLGFLTRGIVPGSHFSVKWRHTGLVSGLDWGRRSGRVRSGIPFSPTPPFWQPASAAVSPHTYSWSDSECPTFSRPECHASVSCLLHKRATTASSPGGEASGSPGSPLADSSSKMKGSRMPSSYRRWGGSDFHNSVLGKCWRRY